MALRGLIQIKYDCADEGKLNCTITVPGRLAVRPTHMYKEVLLAGAILESSRPDGKFVYDVAHTRTDKDIGGSFAHPSMPSAIQFPGARPVSPYAFHDSHYRTIWGPSSPVQRDATEMRCDVGFQLQKRIQPLFGRRRSKKVSPNFSNFDYSCYSFWH